MIQHHHRGFLCFNMRVHKTEVLCKISKKKKKRKDIYLTATSVGVMHSQCDTDFPEVLEIMIVSNTYWRYQKYEKSSSNME